MSKKLNIPAWMVRLWLQHHPRREPESRMVLLREGYHPRQGRKSWKVPHPIKLTYITESIIAFVQNTEQGHILIFNELALKIMLGDFNLNSPGTMIWPTDACSGFAPARCLARRNVSLAFQPCDRKPWMTYGYLFRYYSASPNASVIRMTFSTLPLP